MRLHIECNSLLCVRAGQQMIETFDTNKDGEIDYPEFLAMMRANNKDLQARTCLNPSFRHRASYVVRLSEEGSWAWAGLLTGTPRCLHAAKDGVRG